MAVLLLLALFAQAVLASPRQSLTADEPVYIAAGYAYLRTGDLRLQPAVQHPPLMNVWEAWPLLLRSEAPEVTSVAGWDKSELSRFIVALLPRLGPIQATAFATRVPVVWLAVLLATFVYRWAADWGGRTAGVLALGLFAFDPNLLAHGSLATTDLGVAAFTFIALYGLMRFLRRPAWPMFLLAGVGLGFAMTAKTSGVFLLAALGLIVLAKVRRLAPAMAYLGGLLVLACWVVWAVMGLEIRAPAGWPVPLPATTYWLQVADFGTKSAGGQTAFLMGNLSQHGWWTYYPIAFALKTPLPTCILLAIGLGKSLTSQWKAQADRWLVLGAFPVMYSVAALLSSFNTGYRFLLPVLPFVFVFIGIQVADYLKPLSAARVTLSASACLLVAALLIWQVIGAIAIFPYHLAYFNELAGGPDNGYHFLADSNLDWGQSLVDLKAYLDQRGIAQVRASQYTYTDPAWYGIAYSPLAPMRGAPPVMPSRFDPSPGVYAISATTLQGVMLADPDNYEWFRHQTPTARLGHALFVYDVPPRSQDSRWVAQCAAPVAPLSPEVIAEGLGRSDLRLVSFDCAQSWLFPSGGQSPGWYVLPRDVLRDRFVERHLTGARLSYEQRTNHESPAFAIYEGASLSVNASCTAAAQKLDGPLNFLGYIAPTSVRPGSTIEVETCWRVTAQPERPLSLMLHLVSPDGLRLVADGLGVPVDQWQVGDIIVQRHRLELPSGALKGKYQLLAGAYWLDTLQRWPVGVGGDTLILSSLTVER